MNIFQHNIPWFLDYRSTSAFFQKYVGHKWFIILENGEEYGVGQKIFWNFGIIKFEHTKTYISPEDIKKYGFSHGIIIWTPQNPQEKPSWWKKNIFHNYTLTGISKIEENYTKNWSQRARRSLKKALQFPIKIQQVSSSTFLEIFQKSQTTLPYKKMFLQQYQTSTQISPDLFWNFICYDEHHTPLAGFSSCQYAPKHSLHFIAFQTQEAKKYQAGTLLMDIWHKKAFEEGIHFLNFDHIYDPTMSKDQKGYSDFKENFLQYKIHYPKSYLRFF